MQEHIFAQAKVTLSAQVLKRIEAANRPVINSRPLKMEGLMNKYDTIIFDLDGTLLNSLEDLMDSVNYALLQLAIRQYLRATVNL